MDGLTMIQDDYRFPVEKMSLIAVRERAPGYADQEYRIPDTMQQAIVRTDTGEVLGTHSGKYNMVKHEDIVENIMEGVALADISKDYDHKIKVYENGAKLKGSFIFNDLIQKDPEVNDIIRFKVDYMNSYDGMWSIMVNAYGERLFCLNGCTSPESITHEKNRHTAGFDVKASAMQITQALKVFFNEKDRWDAWRKTKLSLENVQNVFTKTLAKPTTPTLTNKVNAKQLTQLMANYNNERNLLGNNKWAMYNAATYWATHAPDADANKHRVVVRRQDAVQKMLNHKLWEEMV